MHPARPPIRAALLALLAALLLLPSVAHGAANPLTASFSVSPEQPAAQQPVTLTATTTGGAAMPVEHLWDLDDDGEFDDAEGTVATTTFPSDGSYRVRLRAQQDIPGVAGVPSFAERTIVVGGTTPPNDPPQDPPQDPPVEHPQPPVETPNQAPVARFDRECRRIGTFVLCSAGNAVEGESKRLSAAPSSDPDGTIARYEWDLDGDGTYERDTAGSAAVEHLFVPRHRRLGNDGRTFLVGLRVTDDRGASATNTMSVRVEPPKCEQSVKHGQAFTISGTCIRPYKAKVDGKAVVQWRSADPVAINGIAIEPARGKNVQVTVPDGGGNVSPQITSTSAQVSMGAAGVPFVLATGKVDWTLVGGELRGFRVDGTARVNGLRITGLAGAVKLAQGRAQADVHVALPGDFGGTTSSKPIRLGSIEASATPRAAGANDRALSFEVPAAALGPIGLEKLKVSFDGEDLWQIEAAISLPDPAAIKIDGSAGIRSNGSFEHAAAEFRFGNGIPIGGPIPVYLQRIKFRIEMKPKKSECVPLVGKVSLEKSLEQFFGKGNVPEHLRYYDAGIPTFALCGEIGLTAGPSVGGKAAIGLDAGLGFATYDDRPWVMRAFGKLRLVEIPVAEARLAVHGDGYITMQGKFNWGVPDVVSIKGGLNMEMLKTKFNASAYVDACLDLVGFCVGARALVSTKGLAACLKISVGFGDWTPGIGYRWGESSPDLYFDGCSVGRYKEVIKRPKAGSRAVNGAVTPQYVDLPGGLPGAVIAVTGEGGSPRFALVGPKGERIAIDPGAKYSQGDKHLMLVDERAGATHVAIATPSAGRWRLEVEPGSPAITSVKSADGLDAPKVQAAVKAERGGYALRYAVEQREGMKVTFVERGGSAGGQVGAAWAASGSLRFRPADGAAEKRSIVALVEQDGQLVEERTVASYRAPKARKPSRAKRLTVRHAGATASARWASVAGAARYQVRVTLADGRRLVRDTKRNRITIGGLGRAARGSIAVRPITASGMIGAPTSVKLQAAGRRR